MPIETSASPCWILRDEAGIPVEHWVGGDEHFRTEAQALDRAEELADCLGEGNLPHTWTPERLAKPCVLVSCDKCQFQAAEAGAGGRIEHFESIQIAQVLAADYELSVGVAVLCFECGAEEASLTARAVSRG